MYNPKITIITAVYNRADSIEQCISSVINQSYNNLEYIIIDGGSTDGTLDIIKKYSNRIAYWCSEPDEGIYDAWNKGVSHATGEYINFIGSDDAMFGNMIIENAVSHLDQNVDVLAGNVFMVRENGMIEYVLNNMWVKEKSCYKGGCIVTQGTFIKRYVCEKYKFDISYKIAADYKFFLQYYFDESVRIKFIDDIIQYFSVGGASSSNYDLLKNENNRIYKELQLDDLLEFHYRECQGNSNYTLKKVFQKLGVFDSIQKLYHSYIKNDWKRHHCNNKICRWCGRYEP